MAHAPQPKPPSQFNLQYGHLWFVLPGFLFFLAVMLLPLLLAFGISMTNWSGLGNDLSFVGLANYLEIFGYWPFYRAAFHNAVIFLAILVFQHTVGLYLAVLLNDNRASCSFTAPFFSCP